MPPENRTSDESEEVEMTEIPSEVAVASLHKTDTGGTITAEDLEAERMRNKGWAARTYVKMQELGIVKTFGWIFATMMYQVLGATIYIAVEDGYDNLIRLNEYNEKLARLSNRTDWLEELVTNVTNMADMEMADGRKVDLMRGLVHDYESQMGLSFTEPILQQEGWSWLNSIFFCCSFGGRLYPQTTTGQVVTMIYAFIGVPFMLTMTSDLGLIIFEAIYIVWWGYKKRRSDPEKISDDEEADEDMKRALKTSEYKELHRKTVSTFPVSLGAWLSVASQLICAVASQFLEPTWTFFDANYYFMTSFLTIGLGDVQPSAPFNGPEYTLVVHIVLLIFCITFLGLFRHVLSRRIELAYEEIAYAIHTEFRTKQVEPDISVMKCNQGPLAEQAQMALIVRKLGQTESLMYGMMDSSRCQLLHDTWHKKANMKCVEIQTNLPKREIGCQHLMNIMEKDTFGFGDDLGEEPPVVKPLEAPDLRPYVYKVIEN